MVENFLLNYLFFLIFIIIGGIDAGVDITDYVQCKIKSLCAQVDEDGIDGMNKINNDIKIKF